MPRVKLGNVYKSKDPEKSNYIKIDLITKDAITLKHGEYVQVESKAFQLRSVEKALEKGVLSKENAEKAKTRINQIPEYVLGELILVTK